MVYYVYRQFNKNSYKPNIWKGVPTVNRKLTSYEKCLCCISFLIWEFIFCVLYRMEENSEIDRQKKY